MHEEKKRELIQAYTSTQPNYEAFVNELKTLFTSFLNDEKIENRILQGRSKELSKLEEKINRKDPDGTKYLSLTDIEDLAGIRVVFYLEADLLQFVRRLKHEFEVADPIEIYKTRGYKANHFIIKIKAPRLTQPEFSHFADLKCEVQLTTLLYHAWNQLEHDVGYKAPLGLKEFAPKQLEEIRDAFGAIMEKYIEPATHDFETLFERVRRLQDGERLFHAGHIRSIASYDSLEQITQELNLLEKYLPQAESAALQKADLLPPIKEILLKTGFTEEDGWQLIKQAQTEEVVTGAIIAALNILEPLRYFFLPEEIFPILFAGTRHSVSKVSNRSKSLIEKLVKYRSGVIQKVGLAPQRAILDEIEGRKLYKSDPSLTLAIAKELLSSEGEDTDSSEYPKITFSFFALPASTEYIAIRKRVIDLLMKLLDGAANEIEKSSTIDVIGEAVQSPHHSGYSTELEKEFKRSSDDILASYLLRLGALPLSALLEIEEQTRMLANFGSAEKVNALRKSLKENSEYQIYRNLVSYIGRFDELGGHREEESFRESLMKLYLADLSEETWPIWKKRLILIAENARKNIPGGYYFFAKFLFAIGAEKPNFALPLLAEGPDTFSQFFSDIWAGLLQSDQKQQTRDSLKRHLDADRYIGQIINLYSRYLSDASYKMNAEDIDILHQILAIISRKKDVTLLKSFIYIFSRIHSHTETEKEIFVATIKELNELAIWNWTQHFWNRDGSILKLLSAQDLLVLRESLIKNPDIGYHDEEIFDLFLHNDPLEVVRIFKERIDYAAINEPKVGDYDPIPHDLHTLGSKLVTHASKIVNEIFTWLKLPHWRYQWEAAQLLSVIFPGFHQEIEASLITLIADDTDGNNPAVAEASFAIMRRYRGQPFLFESVKVFVVKYFPNDEYESELFSLLSQTGVVTGEHGFVIALDRKIAELESFPAENAISKKFKDGYKKYLEERRDWERKRADVTVSRLKGGIFD